MSNGRLDGLVALITGAAQGTGRVSTELFLKEGAEVIAVDRQSMPGLGGIPRVRVHAVDVADMPSVRDLCADVGRVDVLFNCAGIVPGGSILDCTDEDWNTAFDVNVRSMFVLTREILPGMLERGQGSVINMASVASSVRGVPNRFAYGATKAAVIGLTKALAADFANSGVRFNAICPGTLDTPSLQQRINAAKDPAAARKAFIARQPMGRLGTAEEVAALALYLASPESAYTTGAIHIIDGGWSN